MRKSKIQCARIVKDLRKHFDDIIWASASVEGTRLIIRVKEKENELMEKTIEIKGMMCGHCEATVKKALEKLPGVEEAIVSHEAGTAVVKMSEEVADDVLRSTVEDKDYEVVGMV